MRGGDDVGAGLVDRRVDRERSRVHRRRAVDDVAAVVDEDEVAGRIVAEALAERVDPEQLGELRVAHRDVAGDALAEPELAEDAQRAGELRLAVGALLLDGRERRRELERGLLRDQRPTVDGAGRGRGVSRRGLGDGHGSRLLPRP